jgi:hypothetical protein
MNKITFDQMDNNVIIKKILTKITSTSFQDWKFNNFEIKYLENIIRKKKYSINSNYISLEQSFLILWYLIWTDKNVSYEDKQIYYDLIKYNYMKFTSKKFNFNEIVCELISSTNIIHKKFYTSFYILAEEFHFKYISEYFKIIKTTKIRQNIFYSSNYININPQNILNNFNGEFEHNLNSLNEDITNPFGHNVLIIKSDKNKIYYYDPDECSEHELWKLKFLFKSIEMNFFNISNRIPIQTMTDDSNCVFYCLGLIKYFVKNNQPFELGNLKKFVLFYETFLLSSGLNICNWSMNIN